MFTSSEATVEKFEKLSSLFVSVKSAVFCSGVRWCPGAHSVKFSANFWLCQRLLVYGSKWLQQSVPTVLLVNMWKVIFTELLGLGVVDTTAGE